MSESIFTYDINEYHQEIDPIEHYVDQAAFYLHKTKNIPQEDAVFLIRQAMSEKTGPFARIKDRVIKYARQKENGDREVVSGSLIEYIQDINRNNVIVAPTLTTYMPHATKEALSVKFVDNNKKDRSKAKKLKFKYKISNDLVKSTYYDILQKYKKIINNAFSGAFSSPYTILYFRTGHNTLTTATRLTTSNSNSLNEKLLTGNRHYYSLEVILSNIIFITSQTPKDDVLAIIEKYHLHIPTIEECFQVIRRSATLYCLYHYEEKTLELLSTLDEAERTWFVYCNDFYHIAILNQKMIFDFFDKITSIVKDDQEYIENQVYDYPEEYRMCATQVCYSLVRGYGDKYGEMKEHGVLNTFVSTIRNIYKTMHEYGDLFQTFFRNKVVPHSVAYFPHSLRRCILTSDTDSTIPTYQDLIFWYLEKKVFNEKGRATQGFLILLSTYLTTNTLLNMSAQFNTDRSRLKDIYMKNEFTFDAYVTTQMAKHYYATISVQEGNAFKKPDREYKGVHLVSSNLPLIIREKAKELMNDIMDKSMNNEELSLDDYLWRIKNIEEDIIQSIGKGEITYLKVYKIKDISSYKTDQFNPYRYAELWNMVFAPKTAAIETFPYQAIKISTTLTSKKKLEDWLVSLDPITQGNMRQWVKNNNKKDIPMIMLPVDVIRSHAIPHELARIIDYRYIVKEICKIFYTILGTIGFYVKDKFMVSDYYMKIESDKVLHLLD